MLPLTFLHKWWHNISWNGKLPLLLIPVDRFGHYFCKKKRRESKFTHPTNQWSPNQGRGAPRRQAYVLAMRPFGSATSAICLMCATDAACWTASQYPLTQRVPRMPHGPPHVSRAEGHCPLPSHRTSKQMDIVIKCNCLHQTIQAAVRYKSPCWRAPVTSKS